MTDKDKCECRNNDALLYWCGPKKLRCWHCGREYQAVYVPLKEQEDEDAVEAE
jgi:hypothetical protein